MCDDEGEMAGFVMFVVKVHMNECSVNFDAKQALPSLNKGRILMARVDNMIKPAYLS